MKASKNAAPEMVVIEENKSTQKIRQFINSCRGKKDSKVLKLLKIWYEKNKQLNIFLPLFLIHNDNKTITLLHYFAEKNYPKVLSYLLTIPCQNQDDQEISHAFLYNSHRETALHTAAFYGSTECVKLLLEAKFDPTQFDIFNESTLTNALYSNRIDIVDMLFSAIQQRDAAQAQSLLNTTDSIRKFTMLHLVVFEGYPEMVRWLLKKGADQNLQEPECGATPLMFALAYAFADQATYDKLERKSEKRYPSKDACIKMISIFVEYVQDINLSVRDHSGLNVVDFAYDTNDDAAITLMSDLFPEYVTENQKRLQQLRETPTDSGTSAAAPEVLPKAAGERSHDILKLACNYDKLTLLSVVREMCRRGVLFSEEAQALTVVLGKIDADAYVSLLDGLFNLHKCLVQLTFDNKDIQVCLSIIQTILQFDDSCQLINRLNAVGELLLVKAAQSNRIDLIKCIIAHGANLNARAPFGISILGQLLVHYQQCPDVFKYLLGITPAVFSQLSDAGENLAHQVLRSYQPGVLNLVSNMPGFAQALTHKNLHGSTPVMLSQSLFQYRIYGLLEQSNLVHLEFIYAQADCLLQFDIEPVFDDVLVHLIRMLKCPEHQALSEKLRKEIIYICKSYNVDLIKIEIACQLALYYLLEHDEVALVKDVLSSGFAPQIYFDHALIFACDHKQLQLINWVLIEQNYALEQSPEILTRVFEFVAFINDPLANRACDRLVNYVHLMHDVDSAGDNTLMRAFRRDHPRLVDQLIKQQKYNFLHTNASDETILHMVYDKIVAVKNGRSVQKKTRLKQQAQIKLLLQLFKRLCACHAGLISIPRKGKMLLHSMCEIGDLELLEIGAHDWYAMYNQQSCLDIAFEYDHPNLVDYLFSNAQELFRQKNTAGLTIIQAAIAAQKVEWVRRLMALEPNFCEILARDGRSTLAIAKAVGNEEICALLPKEPVYDTVNFQRLPALKPVNKSTVKRGMVVFTALKAEADTYPEPNVATLFTPVVPKAVMLHYHGSVYFISPEQLQAGMLPIPQQNWQMVPFMHHLIQLQSGCHLALMVCPTERGLAFGLFRPDLTQQVMLPFRHHLLNDVDLVGYLEIQSQFIPVPKNLAQWQIMVQYPQGVAARPVAAFMQEQQQRQYYQQRLFQAPQMTMVQSGVLTTGSANSHF